MKADSPAWGAEMPRGGSKSKKERENGTERAYICREEKGRKTRADDGEKKKEDCEKEAANVPHHSGGKNLRKQEIQRQNKNGS